MKLVTDLLNVNHLNSKSYLSNEAQYVDFEEDMWLYHQLQWLQPIIMKTSSGSWDDKRNNALFISRSTVKIVELKKTPVHSQEENKSPHMQ